MNVNKQVIELMEQMNGFFCVLLLLQKQFLYHLVLRKQSKLAFAREATRAKMMAQKTKELMDMTLLRLCCEKVKRLDRVASIAQDMVRVCSMCEQTYMFDNDSSC